MAPKATDRRGDPRHGAHLLGRHVSTVPTIAPVSVRARQTPLAARACDPEVEDLEHSLLVMKEVLRLQIAMDHALGVCGARPWAELPRVIERHRQEQALVTERLPQRPSCSSFGDDEKSAAMRPTSWRRQPFGCSSARGPSALLEPQERRGVVLAGRQHLPAPRRDRASGRGRRRPAHPAVPQLALDAIPIPETSICAPAAAAPRPVRVNAWPFPQSPGARTTAPSAPRAPLWSTDIRPRQWSESAGTGG